MNLFILIIVTVLGLFLIFLFGFILGLSIPYIVKGYIKENKVDTHYQQLNQDNSSEAQNIPTPINSFQNTLPEMEIIDEWLNGAVKENE